MDQTVDLRRQRMVSIHRILSECGKKGWVRASAPAIRFEEAAMTHETTPTSAQDTAADARAREVEEQMTDAERFSVLISVAGSSTVAPAKDRRSPRT